MAVGGEARGERGGERDESHLGVAGIGILRGLSDVFGDDEFGPERGEETNVIESGAGGASVGGVLGVGDGDGFDGGIAQGFEGKRGKTGVVARPEDERAVGVGQRLRLFGFAGIDHVLRERKVGGHEEVEGRSLNDLRGECGGGLAGGEDLDAGLLLELGEERGQNRLKVSGGSKAESLLGEGGRREKEQKREGEAQDGRG